MVNRGLRCLMLACAFGHALPAHAESEAKLATVNQGPLTVSHLDAIMQEEILYRAQVARAKQQAELAKFDGTPVQTSATDATELPNVAWRRATANGWLAKFAFRDGTSMIAGPGEPLPGGLEVAQISERGIQLRKNGKLIDLSTAAPSLSPVKSPASDASVAPHPDVMTAGLPTQM